jgi:hypothetical protein
LAFDGYWVWFERMGRDGGWSVERRYRRGFGGSLGDVEGISCRCDEGDTLGCMNIWQCEWI